MSNGHSRSGLAPVHQISSLPWACTCLCVGLLLAASTPASAQAEYKLFTLNQQATVNGATFQQASNFFSTNPAAGTGNFKPFSRLQANNTEKGHNTGGALQNDEKSGPWTTNLRFREIPVIGGRLEFFLDINETNPGHFLSLEELKIYVSPTPNLSANAGTLASLGTLVYDMDGAGNSRVVLDYLLDSSGSGRSDLRLLVPRAPFAAACGSTIPCYVYFWSNFGATLLDGTDATSDDGFEEWNLFEREFLGVTKTVVPSFTRRVSWDIQKSASPTSHALFNGETAATTYTVALTRSETDGSWAVSGQITVANPAESAGAFSLTGVSDVILAAESNPQVAAAVECPALPVSIAPGASINCSYTATLPSGADRTNRVTIAFAAGGETFEATRDVPFSFAHLTPTTIAGPDLVSVDDSAYGPLGTTSESKTWTYERAFTCGADAGTHDNTATITETGQTSSASVTVTCYGLTVSKECTTTYKRAYDWTVQKTATNVPGLLTLQEGQVFSATYQIKALRGDPVDSGFKTNCGITVTNTHPTRDTPAAVALADALSGATNGAMSCGQAVGVIGAGDSVSCTYTADLPDATTRTNTATATLLGVDYATVGTDNVTFGAPSEIEDECATTSDPALGYSSGHCGTGFGIGLSKALDTSVCGDGFSFENTARLVETDTETERTSSVTVEWTIPCPGGCTLTQGYWKTHNESFRAERKGNGPPPDATWFDLGDVDLDVVIEGEQETFFLSGTTFYGVMQTPPQGGNVYYSLAHQYIAARLNILAGADGAAVSAAIAQATTFFQTRTPAQASVLRGASRNALVALAGTLASYNEGLAGPGHCSDDGVDASLSPVVASATASAQANASATEAPAVTANLEAALPSEYALSAPQPNPFSSATTLTFDLPEAATVSLRVYDALGREVARLVDKTVDAGRHQATWTAADAAAGVYVVLLEAGDVVRTRRVTVVR